MGKGAKKHHLRSVSMTQTMKKVSAILIIDDDAYIAWCPKCRKEWTFCSEPESTLMTGCACGFQYCVIVEESLEGI